jgi:hypothetical protein
MILVATSGWIEGRIGLPTGDNLSEYLPEQAE